MSKKFPTRYIFKQYIELSVGCLIFYSPWFMSCYDLLKYSHTRTSLSLPVLRIWVQPLQNIKSFCCIVELAHLQKMKNTTILWWKRQLMKSWHNHRLACAQPSSPPGVQLFEQWAVSGERQMCTGYHRYDCTHTVNRHQ